MLNAVLHPTELWAMAKWKLTKVARIVCCPPTNVLTAGLRIPMPFRSLRKASLLSCRALGPQRRCRKEPALVLLHAQQDEPFLRVRHSRAW